MSTLYLRFEQNYLLDDQTPEMVLEQQGNYKIIEDFPKLKTSDKVVLFLAATQVAYHYLDIPTSNKSQKKSAIPFALETHIAQDIEQIYYTWKDELGQVKVCVIARQTLKEVLTRLSTLGIKPSHILAENEGLATVINPEDAWQILHSKTRVVINAYQQNVGIVKQHLSTEVLAKQNKKIQFSVSVPENEVPENFELIEHILIFLAKNTQLENSLNLINATIKKQSFTVLIKRYGLGVVLAVLCLSLLPGYLWLEQIKIQKSNQKIQQEMVKIYQKSYPKAKNIVDPYQQLLSKMKRQSGTKDSQFLPLLTLLEPFYQPDTTIELLSYDKQGMKLKIASDDINAIDDFKNKLKTKFKLEVTKSTQSNGRTLDTILLKKL